VRLRICDKQLADSRYPAQRGVPDSAHTRSIRHRDFSCHPRAVFEDNDKFTSPACIDNPLNHLMQHHRTHLPSRDSFHTA
jgi:hypothetical protein